MLVYSAKFMYSNSFWVKRCSNNKKIKFRINSSKNELITSRNVSDKINMSECM